MRDVTHDDVQRLIGLKHDAGLSPQTLRHIRNMISRVFGYAKRKNAFYGDLPSDNVEMPEMTRKEKHAMTFVQCTRLLDALRSVSALAYAVVLLAVSTNMNIAEMLGLRWKRVNLSAEPVMIDGRMVDGKSVAVRENYYRGVYGTVKAKSRVRDLPITDEVVTVLEQILAESSFTGPEDPVFSNENGKPTDEKNLMRRVIKPIAEKLGMPWMGWHVLRHTHSTLAHQIGMSLTDRQAQLGTRISG